jgi:hypothetical protein
MTKENASKDIEFTPYLATAYAEGFCEGEGASGSDQLRAWAYLVKTRLAYSLQGWFGRTANSLIADGYLTQDGQITDLGKETYFQD